LRDLGGHSQTRSKDGGDETPYQVRTLQEETRVCCEYVQARQSAPSEKPGVECELRKTVMLLFGWKHFFKRQNTPIVSFRVQTVFEKTFFSPN